MIAWLRIALLAAVLGAMTLVLAPLQMLATKRGWPLARRLPWLWHRVACPLAGVRVVLRGSPATGRPLLIAANHQSWADIIALGQVMELSYIAKAEVRDWPVFGLLARLQRTVFVARGERGRTGDQADEIAVRLHEGDAMVLFAEGTTSDGNGVLPFKTALFGAAQAALRRSGERSVAVQPVAIAYTKANGLPLGRYGRPLAAWPGSVTLGPHLLAFLKEGAVDVEISFGDPIRFTPQSDRKAVAREAETAVRAMLNESLFGRPSDPVAAGRLAAEPPRGPMPVPAGRSSLASQGNGVDIGDHVQRSYQKDA